MKAVGGAIAMAFILPVLVFAAISNDLDRRSCGATMNIGGELGDGLTMTPERQQNARTIVDVGLEMGVPAEGHIIALSTAIVESGLINVRGGDRDSEGLFQQRPSQGWGTVAQLRDPEYASAAFYQALLEIPDWESQPPGDVAQAVQRSAYPDRYAERMPDALAVYSSLVPDLDLDPVQFLAACTVGDATGEIVAVTNTGPDILVDSSLAPSLTALIQDAAADGIVLRGWGWRSSDDQIRLRRAHCGSSQYAIYEMPSSQCSPPTARPGTSQHEIGLAVDFNCAGRSFAGTECWRWMTMMVPNSQGEMVRRASLYGLHNLASEPWHWSTTGR